MDTHLKKSKNIDYLIDDYMKKITLDCEKTMHVIKKPYKIKDDDVTIPNTENFYEITKYNYSITQLKSFAKYYKLKISGNKNELILRLYSFLYFSVNITKIQKIFRSKIVRNYLSLHGPAYKNRKLCTNSCDFVTMEPLEEIKLHQFLSYKDEDGFIYGFDIISLHNLYFKSNKKMQNPYNRNIIPENVFKTIKSLLILSRILKIHIDLHYEDDTENVSGEKAIELRALSLFQNIDALGNYTDAKWFLSLNRNNLIKLVRELSDIWNYRAQLTSEVKRNICPPNADPFRNLCIPYIHTESNLCNVKKVILEVLEKFVNTGTDKDSQSLGAYYVLGALTLVNEDAALSLPWLFQSVSYF